MNFLEVVAGVAVVVVPLVGLQTYWIDRSLDAITQRLDRMDVRLDRIEGVLAEQGERIVRVEERRVV